MCGGGASGGDGTSAQALNRYPHCNYMTSITEELLFGDESFAFVYSNIVLQQVPAETGVGIPAGVCARAGTGRCARVRRAGFVRGERYGGAGGESEKCLRLRTRLKSVLREEERGTCGCICFRRPRLVWRYGPGVVVDVKLTNTAAKDLNGRLVYLNETPESGYVGKQYCVVKPG